MVFNMGNYRENGRNGSYNQGFTGDPIADYLSQMGKFELISQEREVELARLYKGGDMAARDELVTANLRFVVSVARRYRNNGLPFADLINEGNYGLIVAAQRFDETRGFKFISYAVWWIRQAIMQALTENQPFGAKVPYNKTKKILKVNKTAAELEMGLGRRPYDEEVAEELGLDERVVSEYRQYGATISLDEPSGQDKDYTLKDYLVGDDDVEARVMGEIDGADLTRNTSRVLSTLNQREERVIRLYFGIGCERHTLQAIGEQFGCTRENIRLIKEKALRRLRQPSRKSLLESYLVE